MTSQSYTYGDAIHEMRMDDFKYDPWGTTMSWWFAVSEEIYFNRSDRLDVPPEWQYCPGIAAEPEERPEAEMVQGMSDDDLMRLGRTLCRLDRICRERGWNY